MSLFLQFDHLTQNETARKAMDSYVGFLKTAFEQYRDLWEDYIKLQEEHEQCKVSPQVTIAESVVKPKDEPTVENQSNSSIVQENDNNSLLELDSLHTDADDFFDDDMEIDLANLSEDFLDCNPSKSPVFSKTHSKTNNTSAKFMQPLEAASVCNKSTTDTSMFRNEEVSSKCKQKLGISTTYHVETTFLSNGKKLKQSRLVFPPAKHDKEKIPLINIDEFEPTSTMLKAKQDHVDTLVKKEPITIEVNNTGMYLDETSFEDVTEISPTQRDTQSKSRHCLKLKRKVPGQTIKNSSDENKHHNLKSNCATKITVDNMDFSLHSSPILPVQVMHHKFSTKDCNKINSFKHNISIHNPSLTLTKSSNKNVRSTKFVDNQARGQTVKDKMQNIFQNDSYGEETFYLPAEQIANENNTDDFTLNDAENKPPAKKPLLNKSHVSLKRKENVSEQFNMRCKADRAKLDGRDCWECEEYYKNLSLSKEELQKRKNQCSRHRQKYERPTTPEGFWDPELPETLSSTYRNNIK